MSQVEQEEEFLTNTLQKKLEKVQALPVNLASPTYHLSQMSSGFCGGLLDMRKEDHSVANCSQPVIAEGPVMCCTWPTPGLHVKTAANQCTLCRLPSCICFLVPCVHSLVLCGLQLIKEKVDLESRLETEQEYVVNKLMKQVSFK